MVTLDTSTTITGYSVYLNGVLEKHGVFDFSEIKLMGDRFPVMSNAIVSFLKKEKPDILYLEEVKVTRNAKTGRVLNKLIGVVYGWCLAFNCEYNEWPPSVTRRLLSFQQGKNNKRESLKSQAVIYVLNKYGVEVPEDEADAICIGDAVLVFFEELQKKA